MSAIDDREAIENYFKFLKEVLDEHALLEKPAQIYNVDESSIPLDHPSSTSCCGERGQQKSMLLHFWQQKPSDSGRVHKCNRICHASTCYF